MASEVRVAPVWIVLLAAVPSGLGSHLGREDATHQNERPGPKTNPGRVGSQPGAGRGPTWGWSGGNPGRVGELKGAGRASYNGG